MQFHEERSGGGKRASAHTLQKALLKVQNRVEKERKFLKGQLEEFWESRKSTKKKELFTVLQTRHTNCQNVLET